MRMEQVTQRTVALTGATRGLGRALAERLLEGGHRLVACGRSEGALKELEQLGGDRVFARPVDVRSAAEVAAWAEEACAHGLVPDLVIANAGKINDPAPLWEVSAEEFDAVLAVNEVLTLHMGPNFILVNVSVDFKDDVPAGEIEQSIENLTREIRDAHDDVKRVFIEAERSRAGAG